MLGAGFISCIYGMHIDLYLKAQWYYSFGHSDDPEDPEDPEDPDDPDDPED